MNEINLTDREREAIGRDKFFFIPCLTEFSFLVNEYGFKRYICYECRGEIFVLFERDNIQIEVAWEPFWPPWCIVFEKHANKFKQRVITTIDADVNKPDESMYYEHLYREQLSKPIEEWLMKAARTLRDSIDSILEANLPKQPL